MARAQKLKVYRTAAGFHDAYVAAPSQKAALEAWGSDKDLFARGMAELVTDAALTAEPLASPGKVVRRSRGTDAEHLASLPADRPPRNHAASDEPGSAQPKHGADAGTTPAPEPKPLPKPSRDAVDEAEAALAALDAAQHDALRKIEREQAELDRRRLDFKRKYATALSEATQERDMLRRKYDRALATWKRSKVDR